MQIHTIQFFIVASLVGAGISYVLSVLSNEKNKEMHRLPRFICLGCLTLFCINATHLIDAILQFKTPYFGILGLLVSVYFISVKLIRVDDNVAVLFQNKWWTQRVASGNDEGDAIRLFSRAGLVPLLPGEVVSADDIPDEVETRKRTLTNVACRDNITVDVTLTYKRGVDFKNVQSLANVEEDLAQREEKVNTRLDGRVEGIVSKVFKSNWYSTVMSDYAGIADAIKTEYENRYPDSEMGYWSGNIEITNVDDPLEVKKSSDNMRVVQNQAQSVDELFNRWGGNKDGLTHEERMAIRERAEDHVLSTNGHKTLKGLDVKINGKRKGTDDYIAAHLMEGDGI